MAEAHNVAGLGISLTHDGLSVTYDQELLRDIWHKFSRAYKKRIHRFKNDFFAGIFPANVHSLVFIVSLVTLLQFFDHDITLRVTDILKNYVFYYIFGDGIISKVLAALLGGTLLWFCLVQLFRLSLKWLLCYKGWMYENPHVTGKISPITKLWFSVMRVICKSSPMLHSFQGALPHLPLPSLDDTLTRHLRSIRPITTDEEYNEMVELTEKFRKGIGRRLQRYLYIKSFLSINYVTDWWEEFVYLRQRSPIMINSNYYGFDTLNETLTTKQAARAANTTWGALLFRRMIERQEFAVSARSPVPFCTMQYSRLFNSCRTPGEETDNFRVWDDAKHIAVYCSGCWYKLPIHSGKRLLEPCELQLAFQEIIDKSVDPAPAEEKLAALTAGERTHWAVTRRKFFSSGVNKSSLHAIERAAFVVILDDEEVFYDPQDPSKLDRWAANLLHGKAYNRWFDKSFNFIISPNGRFGINAEHSWGDAAVTAHFVEYVLLKDYCVCGYTESGDCKGEPNVVAHAERLKWALDDDIQEKIEVSLKIAQSLINDVEMAVLVWTDYGKGFIKKLKISPDAFLQMTLQLTFFRDQGHFALTYEASMTRLYREGRTETVRSCTNESSDFVRAMLDKDQTREERLRLLRIAAERHQMLYRDAMCGQGVDRHLFALYVVQRYLEEESPFMNKVMPPTYLLSTSQTPLNQCEEESKNLSPDQRLSLVSAGGGFGPVADRGYGVSYIIESAHQGLHNALSVDSFASSVLLFVHIVGQDKDCCIEMKLSCIRIQNFFFFNNLEKWPQYLLKDIEGNCFVKPNFITTAEEASLIGEVEPKVKRLKYEASHWDDAIHLFRERKFSRWSVENEAVIQRILEASFPSSSSTIGSIKKNIWSGEAHVLDLHKDGHIRPHIDSIRYCGEIVSGVSLLSDCVMRLRHENSKDELVVDLHLQRFSLYKLSGAGRYEFTHEILPDEKSFFTDERIKVSRGRRISIICRDLPRPKDAGELEQIKFRPIPVLD